MCRAQRQSANDGHPVVWVMQRLQIAAKWKGSPCRKHYKEKGEGNRSKAVELWLWMLWRIYNFWNIYNNLFNAVKTHDNSLHKSGIFNQKGSTLSTSIYHIHFISNFAATTAFLLVRQHQLQLKSQPTISFSLKLCAALEIFLTFILVKIKPPLTATATIATTVSSRKTIKCNQVA